MLLPEETAKVRRHLTRTPIHMTIVVAITLTIAIVPTLIYIAFDGHLDHLLGRAKAVTATVESVEPDGTCGRGGNTEYLVEVSWMLDGEPGNGTYHQCRNAPREGVALQVWVGPTGNVENSSPADDRAGLTALSVILSGLALFIGTWTVVTVRRRFRQLLVQGYGPLSHPIPIELKAGGRGRIWMKHSAPQIMGTTRKRRIDVVLANAHKSKPTLGESRKVYGPWWLYLTQTSDRKRQIGLLVRGDQRCWIHFRRR